MKIQVFKDLREYTLTSDLTAEDILFAKKHCPKALKIQDAEGNDKFSVSYNEGHSSVAAFGITFGAKTADGGKAMISGKLDPKVELKDAGDHVADMIGAALPYITELEKSIPTAIAEVKAQRKALIDGITTV